MDMYIKVKNDIINMADVRYMCLEGTKILVTWKDGTKVTLGCRDTQEEMKKTFEDLWSGMVYRNTLDEAILSLIKHRVIDISKIKNMQESANEQGG